MRRTNTPSVVFHPQTFRGMQTGINLLADVIRPTLGPIPRFVGIEPIAPGDKRPEMLDSGGTIARRILALPNRNEDMGAMFLRHVLWRQHERAGDGTATTAVLFQSIYNQGIAYVAAGGNAIRLRRHLETGMRTIVDELESRAMPLDCREKVAHVAEAMCHDTSLASTLAEIFDIVSEHGPVEIRSGRGLDLERQYVTGSYFRGKLLSQWMVTDQLQRRAQLNEAAVVVTDLELDDPAELVPLLDLAATEQIGTLLLVAKEISDRAISLLLAAARGSQPCQVIAAKAPDAVSAQVAMLDDLAILTGARVFVRAAGDRLARVRREDLGRARRVWADDEFFGVVGGKGSPRTIRAHVGKLRAAYENVEDPEVRKKVRERIGKLLGGTAILWVGGISEVAINARKELAERTSEGLRAAIGKGALPGGGASLLACRPALGYISQHAADLDARTAYRILSRALEEPARTIARNAGYDSGRVLDEIARSGSGRGFDVRSGQIVDMAEAGVLDSAGVLLGAVHEAVAGAALALTIDVLVHKKKPEMSFEP